MKKICFFSLNSYYFFLNTSKFDAGGAELDMFLVGKELALRKDFDISFIIEDFDQVDNVQTINGIKLYKSVKRGNKGIFQGIQSISMLWKVLREINADYYILSGATHYAGVIAYYCKLKNKQFIYRTAHLDDCNGKFVSENGLIGKIYEYGLKNASKILVSVKDHKKILTKKYKKIGHDKNTVFVPLALDFSHESRQNSFLEKESILWVARGTKWKNPKIFLDICSNFPDYKFIMIMPKQYYEVELFEQIKQSAKQISNLQFIDEVPFNEIQKYFDRALVFINTSEAEGFTFTLLQSGLGKTPVLYFKVNPDQIISNENIGYFAEGDLNKLNANLSKLLNDNLDWKSKSDNIHVYVKANHSIEKVIQTYINDLFK